MHKIFFKSIRNTRKVFSIYYSKWFITWNTTRFCHLVTIIVISTLVVIYSSRMTRTLYPLTFTWNKNRNRSLIAKLKRKPCVLKCTPCTEEVVSNWIIIASQTHAGQGSGALFIARRVFSATKHLHRCR